MGNEAPGSLRSDKICIIKNRATGGAVSGWEPAQADCGDLQINAEKTLSAPELEQKQAEHAGHARA
jgi:hypothetical protein